MERSEKLTRAAQNRFGREPEVLGQLRVARRRSEPAHAVEAVSASQKKRHSALDAGLDDQAARGSGKHAVAIGRVLLQEELLARHRNRANRTPLGIQGARRFEHQRRFGAAPDQDQLERLRIAFRLEHVAAAAGLFLDAFDLEHRQRLPGQRERSRTILPAQRREPRGGRLTRVSRTPDAQSRNRAQRGELLQCIYAVAAADGTITGAESAEILSIADELGFTRAEANTLRSAYRDKLSEFQT